MPIRIKDTIYVYYEGYTGSGGSRTAYGVGAFMSVDNGLTFTDPFDSLFQAGSSAFYGNTFGYNPGPGEPLIIYDESANDTCKYKMYLPNAGTSGSTWTGMAYSATGRPQDWKMYTAGGATAVNVVQNSTITTFSATQVTPYWIVRDGPTLKMFAVAYNGTTFLNVEFTSNVGDGVTWVQNTSYVDQLPLRGGTTLSANVAAGSVTMPVTSGSTFLAGETIMYTNGTYLETNRVMTVSGNTLLLLRPVTAALASGLTINSSAYHCSFVQSLYKINGMWYGCGDALGGAAPFSFDFSDYISGATPETATYNWQMGWPLDPMQHTVESTGQISQVPIDEGIRYLTIDR